MNPLNIVNSALYLDRTVQNWHRHYLPDDHLAIDLDLMGACARCYEPLYLIESATHTTKSTGILRSLARRADVPAVLIVHNTRDILSARLLEPLTLTREGPALTAELLVGIRRHHTRTHHGAAS